MFNLAPYHTCVERPMIFKEPCGLRTSEICGRFLEILLHDFENFAKLHVNFAAKSENLRKRAYVMRPSIFLHFLVKFSAILPFYAALLRYNVTIADEFNQISREATAINESVTSYKIVDNKSTVPNGFHDPFTAN